MIDIKISSQIVVVGVDPAGRGGVASVIRDQSKMMSKFNFVKVAKAGFFKYILPFTGAAKSLKYVSTRYKVAHIHSCSGTDFYRSSIFVYLFKLMGKKVILHLHGGMFENFYRSHSTFVRKVCSKCDMLVTVSNYFVELLKHHRLNDDVRLLHNSIPDAAPHTLSKNNDKIVFSFLGAIDKHKGIYEILEAIGENKPLFENKIILKIGGSGNTGYMFDIIRHHGLENMVEYKGWVSDKEKEEFLQTSNVYIQPSHFESFGISILEAMNYGLPIITTGEGGIPDLVTDGVNGLIVRTGNKSDIANAISKLTTDKELRLKLGHASSLKAREFHASTISKHLERLYLELI